jgi:putative N6-adenine-specific DNA methylase
MPEYIAKTLFGMENIVAGELRSLGISDVNLLNRAVSFSGDKLTLYRSNYLMRTALKILVPLAESEVNSEKELYDFIRTIRWDRYMEVKDTLAVEVGLNTTLFKHSQYIAQKIKDAIVDQFRDKFGIRPSVDLDNPSLRINAYINGKSIKVSRDSSGDSLHRRGYRVRQGPAPLNEVLAACLIKISGWTREMPLIDFMCGSGTLPVEAALMALDIAPGDLRTDYGFMKWKDYDAPLFNSIINERKQRIEPSSVRIYASDISAETIRLAMKHAQNAGVIQAIKFKTCHFNDVEALQEPGTVIINPPYGERIVQKNLNELYTEIGNKLKKDFAGYDAWILSGNAEAMKHIGLRPSPKVIVYNGQLECRFNHYSLYSGTKKAAKSEVS